MEYYTIVIVIYNNGTSNKKSIYTVESSDSAIKGVYSNMGTYMAVDGVESVCAMAVNSIGGIYKNEHWNRTVESVEE